MHTLQILKENEVYRDKLRNATGLPKDDHQHFCVELLFPGIVSDTNDGISDNSSTAD